MIVPYADKHEEIWDEFVLKESINGNFLQTRNFINYHPENRFVDGSIIFLKNDRMAAVIPANIINDGSVMVSHQGSTYGGLIVGKDFARIQDYNWIFSEMMTYLHDMNYRKVYLKMHNWLYSPIEEHNELCEYYFQLNHFSTVGEIGFFIDLKRINADFSSKFEKLKRRKLSKANNNNLIFKKLKSDDEIESFYYVLEDNMKKFNILPYHTKDELIDFKNSRLKDVTSFYGVFHNDVMIAGSMVWDFCDRKVFHTQYLASRMDSLELCPNEFLYSHLIQAAVDEGFRYLSFGTASLEHGQIINEPLARFKEGFNTDSYINRCYIWEREQ